MTAVDVENSSQSNSELATSAGNYNMGSCNANNCTTSVCGNATSQPNANNISGSAIVNVTSDVFASNSPYKLTYLAIFYDSLEQIVLHLLRDLDEYYRTNNVPEPETIGDKFMKACVRMRKKAKDRRERRKTGSKTWGPKVKEKVLVKAKPASDAAVGVTLFIRMKAYT